MKMKIATPVSLLLAVLLLSGCISPVSQTPEQKAIALADGTTEGGIATALGQSLGKIQNCTVDEFAVAVVAAQKSTGTETPPEVTEEQKAQLASMLEQTKRCAVSIRKTATETAGGKYLVAYSFSVPEGCGDFPEESFIEVEADTGSGTAVVAKGAIPEDQREQVQAQMEAMSLMGDCAAMLFMSSVSSSMPVGNQPEANE